MTFVNGTAVGNVKRSSQVSQVILYDGLGRLLVYGTFRVREDGSCRTNRLGTVP